MSYFKKSLLLHLVIFVLIGFFYHTSPSFQKRRVIHTSTVKLASSVAAASETPNPPSAVSQPTPTPPPPAIEPPKPKEAIATPKKQETKQQVAKTEPKKEEKKKKEIAKTAEPKIDPKKGALLKEARESLAKMGTEKTTKPTTNSGRSTLSTLNAEKMDFSIKGSEDDLYTLELIKRLKLHFRLPENGEVVVDLTLKRSGKVVGIKIIDAKSSSNKYYVESHLPTIAFPEFGESYPQKEEKLFTLSFKNEIF